MSALATIATNCLP